MDGDLDRRIGASALARLLGEWRPPAGRGLADALADRVRLLVLDGRLPLRTRLPAERELATTLRVSRATVAAAYESLRAAGTVHSRRGAGSWTQLDPCRPAGGRAAQNAGAPLSPHGDLALFDLAHAASPAPAAAVAAASAAAVTDLEAYLGGHGYDLGGLPVLRAAIAARYVARGLPTTPDQVLVTAGAQHAIGLALLALTTPGDRVLVEHPTYPSALDAMRARGVRPVPVPMVPGSDGAGTWDLELLAASVRDAAPRLAYLVTDFQNPTGGLLDAPGRLRLVELARRTGTPLLIDETLAELALDGPVPPPVAAHGAPDSPLVITVGSASKTFWGGLRIGWIRTAAPLVRRLAAARPAVDLGTPVLEQLVATRLVSGIDTVLPARRDGLAAGRDHLVRALASRFPAWTPSRPAGGMSLWIDLGEPVSSRLTTAARRRDVLLAAGPRFGVDGAFERFLRLPFTLATADVDAALDRLAAAAGEVATTPMTDQAPFVA